MKNIEQYEEKYIDLLLKRCINFNQAKSLLIHCDLKEHIPFAKKIKEKVKEYGVLDVCIHINDKDEIHEYLKNTKIDNIKLNPIIDKRDWSKYAKKGAPIVFLNSSVPGLMNDIEPEKISKMTKVLQRTNKYYRDNVSKYKFPWCIIALPNERWAKSIFPNDKNAYEKLYLNIMKMCMIDKENPIQAWNDYIEKNNYYKNKLNELKITKMHYTNSLGTDFTLELPKKNIWENIDKVDISGGKVLVNMPSYETFTSPDYRKTNGIVYASKPLIYNGCYIEDFNLTFKDGKVVSCHAKKGEKVLEQMIKETKNMCYLGEVALVPYDSPISNTGLVFNDTLFDENASCHLALGDGFPECFNSKDLSDEELVKKGLNISKNHVDFMIGTSDLNIEAETNEGKVLIFKNGNFNI